MELDYFDACFLPYGSREFSRATDVGAPDLFEGLFREVGQEQAIEFVMYRDTHILHKRWSFVHDTSFFCHLWPLKSPCVLSGDVFEGLSWYIQLISLHLL